MHTPELYPPLSASCTWETLAAWLPRQEALATVLLLLLYLYERHDPSAFDRLQCLGMAYQALGEQAVAPFVRPDDRKWRELGADTTATTSWARIRPMQTRLIVHLQQKGILYLIRRQHEDEQPCCRATSLPLTLELAEPARPLALPAPPAAAVAPFLPQFSPLPDDWALQFTPHGFTVKRISGFAGDALQALWVYANRELHKVPPGTCEAHGPTLPPAHHRNVSTELVALYESEETRQQNLRVLQQQADAQLRHVAHAFLDAYASYQETCAELRQQQELLSQLCEDYALPPRQPFCHHSSLLARLQHKMRWSQWLVRQGEQLACRSYPQHQLQQWYMQAHMCQASEERQLLRTVTQHADGTTVQHELHRHTRTLAWKAQMLPPLLHMSDDMEQHFSDHQLRIDWLECLLQLLHAVHQHLESERQTLQESISQSAS